MHEMKIIEVFYRNELLSEHNIEKEGMKIGRARWNDIILADPTVSREHAKIKFEKGKLTLVDNSSAGTYINSKKVSRKELNIDDRITIGPYSLFLRQYKEGGDEAGVDSTIFRETLSLPSIHGQDGKSFLLHEASLRIVTGPAQGRIFPVNKEKVTLGKSGDNDLVLADEFVSRYHAEVSFKNGDFFVRDLGSKNGILVEGKRVQGAILRPFSTIGIGQNEIEFLVSREDREVSSEKDVGDLGIIGISPKFLSLCSLLKKAASCDATALICGDTGTGKELAARTIHALSNRSEGPFVTIDCGSIPRDLIESELFGHEKGAFTGAGAQRKGAFERGDHGTVFLDEIGELPKELQPKLLRILEERSFKRVGGDAHIPTNIRVIAATNRELNKEVMKGNFREDLFFRLYVIPICMPPLRERGEDIPLLAEFFMQKFKATSESGMVSISADGIKKLKEYAWPGNVRELKNTIERAIVSAEGETITAGDIHFIAPIKMEDTPQVHGSGSLEDIEKQTIINALKAQGGNKKATAKVLGIAYSTMCEKVKKYKIDM